jgi:hypothetical protein
MKIGKRTLGLGHSRPVEKKIRGRLAFLSFFRKISISFTNDRKIHKKIDVYLSENTNKKNVINLYKETIDFLLFSS